MPKKRGNNEGTIVKRKDGRWEARASEGTLRPSKVERKCFYPMSLLQKQISYGGFCSAHESLRQESCFHGIMQPIELDDNSVVTRRQLYEEVITDLV